MRITLFVINHTLPNAFVIQFLLNSLIRKIMPRKHNSMHMAIHTPLSPIVGANKAASDSRIAQMLKKFIRQGTSVLAAPTNTPYATIDAANIGSANASMRNAIIPNDRISSTGVINPMICGAKIYMSNPINPMIIMPINTVMKAKLRVRRLRFAPTLWPTNVVAASEMPYPGI